MFKSDEQPALICWKKQRDEKINIKLILIVLLNIVTNVNLCISYMIDHHRVAIQL